MDRVEVLEQGSDGTFGGVCGDGLVYNIEVEGTHTYVADGFVVHNCHHAAAVTWRRVLDHFASAAKLGVSATPERHDEKSLRQIFGSPSYRYPIRRGVHEGYLSDIVRAVEMVPGLDLSHVAIRAGDFDSDQLEAQLLRAPAVAAVADAVVRRVGDRPTILFCAGIAHSRAVALAINAARPGMAVSASGEDRAGLEVYRSRQVQILCQTDLATEGFDDPATACVGLVRPSKSTGRVIQQIGRGTRLAPDKDKLLVLEFIGGETGSQVSTVDAIGKDYSDRVRGFAEQLLDKSPAMSVLAALEHAAVQAKEGAIGYGRARLRPVIDPMRVVLALDGMVLEAPRPGAAPATSLQAELLAGHGLVASGLDVRQASILLDGIRWRRKHKRPSPLQALTLYQYGFDLECSGSEALRLLAQVRAN